MSAGFDQKESTTMSAHTSFLRNVAIGLALVLAATGCVDNKKLELANARSAELQAELAKSDVDRQDLQKQLAEATKVRDEYKDQMSALKAQADTSAKRSAMSEQQLGEAKASLQKAMKDLEVARLNQSNYDQTAAQLKTAQARAAETRRRAR
jgi:chromosome segregation ATPase